MRTWWLLLSAAGLVTALPTIPQRSESLLQQAWSWLKGDYSKMGVSSRGELANYPNGGNKYKTGEKGETFYDIRGQKILLDYNHDKESDTDWVGLGLKLGYKDQSALVKILNNLQDGNSSFIWDFNLKFNQRTTKPTPTTDAPPTTATSPPTTTTETPTTTTETPTTTTETPTTTTETPTTTTETPTTTTETPTTITETPTKTY